MITGSFNAQGFHFDHFKRHAIGQNTEVKVNFWQISVI